MKKFKDRAVKFVSDYSFTLFLICALGLMLILCSCTPTQVASDVQLAEEVINEGEQLYNAIYNAQDKTIHLQKVEPTKPKRGFRQVKLRRLNSEENK